MAPGSQPTSGASIHKPIFEKDFAMQFTRQRGRAAQAEDEDRPQRKLQTGCIHCGCTDERACQPICWWVDEHETVCSTCVLQRLDKFVRFDDGNRPEPTASNEPIADVPVCRLPSGKRLLLDVQRGLEVCAIPVATNNAALLVHAVSRLADAMWGPASKGSGAGVVLVPRGLCAGCHRECVLDPPGYTQCGKCARQAFLQRARKKKTGRSAK